MHIRLNWAGRTYWGWWDDTGLQTQDSKFEPWRSEAEHATSPSRRLPTILTFTRGWGRNSFVSFKPPRPGTEPRTLVLKAAVLTTPLGPPPYWWNGIILEEIQRSFYRVIEQYGDLRRLKQNFPKNEVVLWLDYNFAKNYTSKFEDEIMPYHWTQKTSQRASCCGLCAHKWEWRSSHFWKRVLYIARFQPLNCIVKLVIRKDT